MILGDIMISIPRMEAQAQEFGHSQIREFSFLVAHSILHLLGYDHMTPEEAAVMEPSSLRLGGITDSKMKLRQRI